VARTYVERELVVGREGVVVIPEGLTVMPDYMQRIYMNSNMTSG
jgi:hypothetical protein